MQHPLQDPIGLSHFVAALLALCTGTLVICLRKGTPTHKWLGRAYVSMMILVNLTALLIYELFGGFGLFHWLALASLLTVLFGYLPARLRRPGWKARHAYMMSGSYVGLMAALAAEVLTRTPLLPFYGAVFVASFAVTVGGLLLMYRLVPRLL